MATKYSLLGLLCALLFSSSAIGLELTTSPPYLVENVIADDFLEYDFGLRNPKNVSEPVTLSKSGDLATYITLGTSSFSIPPNSSTTIHYFVRVPNVQGGVMNGNIHIVGSTDSIIFPVTLIIEKNETGDDDDGPTPTSRLLEPVITEYNKYVEQGTQLAITPKVYNPQNFKVDILTVESGGTTQQFFRPEWEVPSAIQSGGILSLPVTIVTEGAKVGVYQPYIDVVAIYDGLKETSRITFKINVIYGTGETAGADEEIEIHIPSQITVGETFTVTALHLETEDSVRASLNPFNAVLLSSSKDDDSWEAKYKVNRAGTYTMTIEVYRHGALAAANTTTITTGAVEEPPEETCTLNAEYTPDAPGWKGEVTLLRVTQIETGDDVTSQTEVYLDGVIWPRGSKITLGDTESHSININPLESFECNSRTLSFNTPQPKLQIVITPSTTVVIGDTVSVAATDASGTAVSATVTYAGTPYATGTPIQLNEQGTFTLTVSKEGYQSISADVTVLPPLSISAPITEIIQGEPGSVNLSRDEYWILMNEAGEPIDQGYGNSIMFTEEVTTGLPAGTYSLLVGADQAKIGEIRLVPPGGFPWEIAVIIIVILAVIVVFVKFAAKAPQDSVLTHLDEREAEIVGDVEGDGKAHIIGTLG